MKRLILYSGLIMMLAMIFTGSCKKEDDIKSDGVSKDSVQTISITASVKLPFQITTEGITKYAIDNNPDAIAFDGVNMWTANIASGDSPVPNVTKISLKKSILTLNGMRLYIVYHDNDGIMQSKSVETSTGNNSITLTLTSDEADFKRKSDLSISVYTIDYTGQTWTAKLLFKDIDLKNLPKLDNLELTDTDWEMDLK